jgi:hypothetical protein
MSAVEELGEGGQGKRAEQKLEGGFYTYQRDLWRSVAELNFCLYWNQTFIHRTKLWKNEGGQFVRRFKEKLSRQHRIVGRQVNVKLTIAMAEYLEQAIERILRERLEENNEQFRSKWATSFREGAADIITDKLYDRRREIISEQQRKQHEARQAASAQTVSEVSSGTGLTLATLAEQEKDANWDFLYGEGWSAQRSREAAERRQREAEASRAAREAYTAWCEANPEEAARQEKEAAARERRNAARRTGPRYRESVYKGDASAFRAGREAGRKISIDQQAGRTKAAGAIG